MKETLDPKKTYFVLVSEKRLEGNDLFKRGALDMYESRALLHSFGGRMMRRGQLPKALDLDIVAMSRITSEKKFRKTRI